MASAAGDSAGYGGARGAGGAVRRKPTRSHQSTPYDRPATAVRISQRNTSGGTWLSKFVDPASKLITAGAHKLFSSVFRKHLLLPSSPPQQSADETREPRAGHMEAAATGNSSGLHEGAVHESETQKVSSKANEVTELESILMQKTFTRSEIDHLTALLQSRTSNGIRPGEERTELKSHDSLAAVVCDGEHLESSPCKIETNHSGSPATVTTPALKSKVNEDDIASPAELAKAYMGSRASKVSPSMLGSRTQLIREVPVSNAPSPLKNPSVPQVQKLLSGSGISENNMMVSRSRDRPAMFRSTPSPYSRVQPVGALKGFGSRVNAFDVGQSSSQQVLKRRHSVLENDIGSVGPIRRTRQKSNLVHLRGLGLPSSSTLPLTKGNTSEAGGSSSDAHRSFPRTPANKIEKNIPMRISSQSIEMGERILQQLEKLTPPGEKLSNKKPGATMEMTPGMLHGKARRSLETVDSLKHLENAGPATDEVRMSSKKKDVVLGEGSNSKVTMSDLRKGVTKVSDIGSAGNNQTTVPTVPKSVVDVPKRSRAFQMSAHEDYLDFDDDVHSNGFASSSMNGNKEPLDKSGVQPHVAADKMEVPSPSPELKQADSLFKKNGHSSPSFADFTSAEKSTDGSLASTPVSSVFGSATEPSVAPPAIVESNKVAFSNPTVSIGNNGPDKASPASLLTSSPVQESSFLKDVNSHSPSSVVEFSTPTMDNRNTGEDVDTQQKSKLNSPFSLSGASTGTSLFGTPASSTPMNGPFSFSTTVTSSPTSPSAFFSTPSEPKGNGATDFTANTFTTTSVASAGASVSTSGGDADKAAASAPFGTSTGNLTSSSSPFPFPASTAKEEGSSSAAASTSEISSKPAVTTGSASKSQELSFGNNAANPASAANAGTVGNGFHYGASATNPIGNFKSQTSSQDTSGKSIFGNLPTSIGFAASTEQPTFSTALPSQSSSGSAVLTPVSPIFGSSTPASGSGFALGASLSTSSSTKAPESTTAFGSSVSGNQSSGFAFGVSSSASAPASSAPSTFIFGAPSSSAAPASNSPSAFSFGGSSSSTTPAQTNSTSSGFSFGLGSSAAVPAANSGPAPSFAFGGSTTIASSGPASSFAFGGSATTTASSGPASFGFGGSANTTASTSASSSPFQFGASSTTQTSNTSMFNSAGPSSVFAFGAAAPSSSAITTPPALQPVFGNGGSMFPFGSSMPGNNDQMTMEDSMAEDSSNPHQAAAPVFGQSSIGQQQQQQPSGGFGFGTPPPQPAAANPFQFGGQQQGQVGVPQNSSLFGTPAGGGGSFELGGSGSFSLGAGGNDKSGRRIVRVNRKLRKK